MHHSDVSSLTGSSGKSHMRLSLRVVRRPLLQPAERYLQWEAGDRAPQLQVVAGTFVIPTWRQFGEIFPELAMLDDSDLAVRHDRVEVAIARPTSVSRLRLLKHGRKTAPAIRAASNQPAGKGLPP